MRDETEEFYVLKGLHLKRRTMTWSAYPLLMMVVLVAAIMLTMVLLLIHDPDVISVSPADVTSLDTNAHSVAVAAAATTDNIPSPAKNNISNPCWRQLLNPRRSQGGGLPDGQIQGGSWHPEGSCELWNLTRSDIKDCLVRRENRRCRKGNDVWFLGDSRIRNIWSEGLDMLVDDHPLANRWRIDPASNQDCDWSINVTKHTHLNFWCDQYLVEHAESLMTGILSGTVKRPPSFVFLSAALWFVEFKNNSIEQYYDMLNKIQPVLVRVAQTTDTKIVWVLQDHVNETEIRLMNLGRKATNTLMKVYNFIAENIFENTPVLIWRSGRELAEINGDFKDGYHLGRRSIVEKTQIMFNIVCQQYEEEYNSYDQLPNVEHIM